MTQWMTDKTGQVSSSVIKKSSDLWSGFNQDRAGNIVSGAVALVGIAESFENPGAFSWKSELLGESWTLQASEFQSIQPEAAYVSNFPKSFKLPDLGIAPSLISGGLTDSPVASTLSDAFGGTVVDSVSGSKVGPVVYNTLSAVNQVNDIAEKGHLPFELSGWRLHFLVPTASSPTCFSGSSHHAIAFTPARSHSGLSILLLNPIFMLPCDRTPVMLTYLRQLLLASSF
jgi:hypothetical protein